MTEFGTGLTFEAGFQLLIVALAVGLIVGIVSAITKVRG
jgi:flagellar biosynthesis protein FliQ